MKLRQLLLSFLALFASFTANAYDAKINGIYYNFSGDKATVTGVDGGYSYSGNVVIPEYVTYNNKTYSVTSIGSSAFFGCSGLTFIFIPNSVTSIGSSAFSGCSGLTSVIIPESVTSIGDYTFNNCGSLTYVIIPESVTSIGRYAFQYCTGLTSITIPNSVTSIGYAAFSGCSGLTSVIIPESVTSIGGYAFHSSGLTSITIPNSVTSIGGDAFEETPWYDNQPNGLVYAGKVAYKYKGTMPAGTQIVIKEGTLAIANNAFQSCNRLTSITIPNSVTSIGSSAFYECSSLISVNIPDGVTSIGGSAFYNCSGLTSVTIGNSVTSIGGSAFYNCSGLTSVTIGNSVTRIGESAFYHCSSLTSITIPNSVTSIGEGAFRVCTSLTSVTIPNSVTSIGSSVFSGCNGLTSITIPNSVTSIGEHAFFNCSGLTSVTIPNSVTSIGSWAFDSCRGLTSVTIPNSVTSIGAYAFWNCSSLTSVVSMIQEPFPFGNNAFSDISSNCVLTIPKGLRSLYIAAGWTTSVFKGGIVEAAAPSPNITFADANVKALCVANWDTNGDGELSEAEAAAVPDLGTVFRYNNTITSFNELQYFTGLNSIGYAAFSGCSGLTSITIPNSVTSIGENAFDGCSGLTSITIPNSVTSIGENAFSGCSGLTSIIVESGNTVYDSRNNCNAIIATATNTLITGCINTIIPNSVTSIGYAAFSDCSGLTSVTIPNSVTSIGNYAFYNCSGLTSITIPNSVTSIGTRAFSGCSGLTSVTIPNSVTSIGKLAFYECSALTSVTIPNSVTSIGHSAFYGCDGLTSVTIPNSVISIGEYAFEDCTGLTSVTIPESVTSIGEEAFSNCSGLTDVYCLAEKVPTTVSNTFYDSPISSATLHVPASSINSYKTTAPWSGFGTIVAIEEEVQSNTIACADITARSGQQVELPIMLTNDADLTIVGISFTLKLPEEVTVAKDEYGDPLYSLENTRLNPKRFSVYTSQYADGSWGFRISTNNTTAVLNGTEGVFMTLTLDIADSMAEGDYSISLTDNKLSVRNSDNIVSKPLSNSTSTLTINNVIMGDVNGDGEVDLSDAIMVTYYSLNVVLPEFITAAADMNDDGEIDLSDAIIIIYKSLGVLFGNNARRPSKAAESNNDYLQLGSEGNNFGMNLSNEGIYVGFQCDIKLPAGTTLNSIDLNGSRAANHTLMYNQLEDGSYRVAAFSANGDTFSGNMGELLAFTTDGTVQGKVSIENIFFVDKELRKVAFDDLSAIATGIGSPLGETEDGAIYDIQGRKMSHALRGINIIRYSDGTSKKVLVK